MFKKFLREWEHGLSLIHIFPDQNVDFLDTIKGTVVATLLIELIIGILSIYFSIVDYSNEMCIRDRLWGDCCIW